MDKNTVRINILVLITMLLVAEVSFGYLRSLIQLKNSSLLHALTFAKHKFMHSSAGGDAEKLAKVQAYRQEGIINSYPAYRFEPYIHRAGSEQWFGHPPKSLVVYCNEGSGITEFKTNYLGFREVINQNLAIPLDLILVGDSFTEGACVDAPHDIASVLGIHRNLFNLGRGGTGPIFQLGAIKELFEFANSGKIHFSNNFQVVWIIYTGNDLADLVKEKQTNLSKYLTSKRFTANYFQKVASGEIQEKMDIFHDSMLHKPELNSGRYGDDINLVPGSVAEKNALMDFSNVIEILSNLVKLNGGQLSVIILENHPRSEKQTMLTTQNVVREECDSLSLDCFYYNLSNRDNKTSQRSHLSPEEYQQLGNEINKFLQAK